MVLEALRSEKADAEVARAYQVHPITVSKWKKEFLEKGAEVSDGSDPPGGRVEACNIAPSTRADRNPFQRGVAPVLPNFAPSSPDRAVIYG